MRKRRIKAASVCAVATVLVCLSGAGDALAAAGTTAAAEQVATADVAKARRDLDAIGGSGSAGVDPVAARKQVKKEQDELTGDIMFSPPSGTFTGTLSLTLRTAIAGAEIRYTTDGTVPAATSTVYGSALSLTKTTQVRAQAYVGGAPSGAMGSAVYVARSFNATHDLPLLLLDAYGGGKPPLKTYRNVAAMLMEPRNATASLSQAPAVSTRAGFHVRGQSSSNFDKVPYRLELWDNQDTDAEYPLLRMPADGDWALRGPFPDKTLIRDAYAYTLGRDMGLRAPRFAFVEVYVNLDAQPMAPADYQGVYMLVETIENTPDRLGLARLTPTDLTEPAVSGGYAMKFNMMVAEQPLITCAQKDPKDACWRDLELIEPEDPTAEQKAWITSYVQKFHDSLRSANPSDPRTGYPAYIDVDSFVNRIIHNELAREGDAYLRSTHFTKDRNGKLVAGPLWDYDLGFAAFTGFGGPSEIPPGIEGWQFEPMMAGMATSDWFVRLMQDPAFQAKIQARWQQLRRGVLSDARLASRIAVLSAPLKNAADRNFQKWPILDKAMVGNFGTQVTKTWPEQLDILKNFVTKRAAWIDGSGWKPLNPEPIPMPTDWPMPSPTPSSTSTSTPTSN